MSSDNQNSVQNSADKTSDPALSDSIVIGDFNGPNASLQFTVGMDTLELAMVNVHGADSVSNQEIIEFVDSLQNSSLHWEAKVYFLSGSKVDSSYTLSVKLAQADINPNNIGNEVILKRDGCTQKCTSVHPCIGCDFQNWGDCSGVCSCNRQVPFETGGYCKHTVSHTTSGSISSSSTNEKLADELTSLGM